MWYLGSLILDTQSSIEYSVFFFFFPHNIFILCSQLFMQIYLTASLYHTRKGKSHLGCILFTYAGCCFIKYATSEEANRAIRGLHNQRTLPGVSSLADMHSAVNVMRLHVVWQSDHSHVFQGVGPIQVRYADGERERLGNVPYLCGSSFLNMFAYVKFEKAFCLFPKIAKINESCKDM